MSDKKKIKIELTKTPNIKFARGPIKVNVNLQKLEGIVEVEGNLITNPFIDDIVKSLSEKSIELKISECNKDFL